MKIRRRRHRRCPILPIPPTARESSSPCRPSWSDWWSCHPVPGQLWRARRGLCARAPAGQHSRLLLRFFGVAGPVWFLVGLGRRGTRWAPSRFSWWWSRLRSENRFAWLRWAGSESRLAGGPSAAPTRHKGMGWHRWTATPAEMAGNGWTAAMAPAGDDSPQCTGVQSRTASTRRTSSSTRSRSSGT